ncbi:MAG: phospholipid carrier-dependent glycosyltransferase [Patescibacteria group bacterium]
MLKKIKLNQGWLAILVLLILSLVLHFWHLGKISEKIFDEVYFVEFAKNYLSSVSFFDIHPPLGKLILALGIKIFGDDPFGWRIMPAIFGSGLIFIGFLAGRELTGKVIGGIFSSLILFFDGLILVYSRVGLIDIFLAFFILLSFYSFLRFINSRNLIYLYLAGFSLGLAASVKYIGALILLIFICVLIIKKMPIKKYFFSLIISLIIIPSLVYISFFLFNFGFNASFFSQLIQWHQQSFNYNLSLSEGHPYASKWWSWFLLLRPIWLYFKDSNGDIVGINGLGNPLAWWSAIIIIPLLIWQSARQKHDSLIILSAFLIFLLPWAFFKRVLFLYHAMPSFLFLTLAGGLEFSQIWSKSWGKTLIVSFFIIMGILFIFFLPIWLGIPISQKSFYQRIWFKSWI